MPQWDFLDFLATQGRKLPNFHLLVQTQAKDLIAQGERICGVLAMGPAGNVQIRAGLTIATDGRHSTMRDKFRLTVDDLGAPFDVLWLSLPVLPGDPADLIGKVRDGQLFVMIYRTNYWRCAYLIPKGAFDAIKADGLTKFRNRLKSIAGFAADRIDEAIKDAVATANILSPVLTRGVPTFRDLKKVQKRRQFPTRVIQDFQVIAQKFMLAPTLAAVKKPKPPRTVRLLNAWPRLRQLPARFIGMGVRSEHVRLPMR